MSNNQIDYDQLAEWVIEGKLTKSQMARRFGVSPAAVTKACKKYGYDVAKHGHDPIVAKKWEHKSDVATETLLYLVDRARSQLEWLDKEKDPKKLKGDEYLKWQDQGLKFGAEMRKLIDSIANVGHKLYIVKDAVNFQQIVIEAIGRASPDVQRAIRQELIAIRETRFPGIKS